MDPDLQDSHSEFRVRDLQYCIGDGRTIAWTAHAQMRVADVLVLLGAYRSAEEPKAGLAVVPRDPKQHRGKKLPARTCWQMIKRMAHLLEALGPGEENRGRLRAAPGWACSFWWEWFCRASGSRRVQGAGSSATGDADGDDLRGLAAAYPGPQ